MIRCIGNPWYKNDVNETTQDDEDDDVHDEDENAQADDDEEQTESEVNGDDFIHPKLTTHDDEIIHEEETDEDDTFDPIVHTPSHISSSDDEDSDNDVEGTNVEGANSDEDATYEEDQGNEVVEDTNANLEGRDDVMTDAILLQLFCIIWLRLQHAKSNQDTGVDAIFGQHAEATSLIDIPVTAIVEPSFFAPTNRPPTPNPLFIQLQQPPILTPATTPSSLLQNLPDFGSLFGFDYRLKALEDNFSELKQTNQYAEALSSIPGIVDQYLANKMQEAVDVAVQLKYDRIREEAHTDNQQFLDSIDEGMKKVIKEQVKKKVSKITPKLEKLVNEQLESEVLVRSSKEAKTSHAIAANLSELELKKILIDKMEANNSINRSDIQRQLYKALVDAYEADKILLDTYGDTVTIKRPRDGADDDQEPSAGTDRGSKRRRSGKEPESTSAPRETTTTTAGKTTTGSKTHKQSASQSAPVEETMQSTDVFEAPAHQEFETGVHDEQAEEEVHHLPDWFQQPKRLPSPDHAWNRTSSCPINVEPSDSQLRQGALLGNPTFGAMSEVNSIAFGPQGISHTSTKKRRIIAVTKVEIVEWQNYKHLDWITIVLHLMYLRSSQDVLLSKRGGDLQLGVESYQKKTQLPKKPDTLDDGTLDDVRLLNGSPQGTQNGVFAQTFWSQVTKQMQEL
ncbi:hypothetical protein Tco_0785149 [Tanacetum coccineum]